MCGFAAHLLYGNEEFIPKVDLITLGVPLNGEDGVGGAHEGFDGAVKGMTDGDQIGCKTVHRLMMVAVDMVGRRVSIGH